MTDRLYTTGMEHSPISTTGSAWERTPWHATRRAASEALQATVLEFAPDEEVESFLIDSGLTGGIGVKKHASTGTSGHPR